MTNYEKIKAMSQSELMEFFASLYGDYIMTEEEFEEWLWEEAEE